MPRMARVVVPGYPHHITQRGNRRQQTFFEDSDYLAYIDLLSTLKDMAGVDIWAYCLMPNHVHVVAVPAHKQSLAKLFGTAHHRYARRINSLNEWQGHLWQERFRSSVMDEEHLLAAVRYIELNPVRAGLCSFAEEWRWSSIHAHISGDSDKLVSVSPMHERISDWLKYLSEEGPSEVLDKLRAETRTGRPSGSNEFIESLEETTGLQLRRRKPGPASIS